MQQLVALLVVPDGDPSAGATDLAARVEALRAGVTQSDRVTAQRRIEQERTERKAPPKKRKRKTQ